jgi:hypothetical protein
MPQEEILGFVPRLITTRADVDEIVRIAKQAVDEVATQTIAEERKVAALPRFFSPRQVSGFRIGDIASDNQFAVARGRIPRLLPGGIRPEDRRALEWKQHAAIGFPHDLQRAYKQAARVDLIRRIDRKILSAHGAARGPAFELVH